MPLDPVLVLWLASYLAGLLDGLQCNDFSYLSGPLTLKADIDGHYLLFCTAAIKEAQISGQI
jgi:hypothetical protein